MKLNKIYVVILLLTIVSSMFVVYKRTVVESPYKTYETVMDYEEVKNFADATESDPIDVAKDFMDVGVNSFAINENTISSLKINQNYDISVNYHGLDMYITGDKSILNYIKNGIADVASRQRNLYFKDDNTLVIEGRLSDFSYGSYDILRDYSAKRIGQDRKVQSIFENVGLGFTDSELEKLKANDIPFNLRPVYTELVQDSKKTIDRYFAYVREFVKNPSLLIFSGRELLGGEKGVDYLAQKIKETDIIPVTIETSEQDGNTDLPGIKKLAKLINYKFTRLFSTFTYIQDRYDYKIPGHHNGQEIMNSYYRAITERNIRVIYFKVFRPKNGAVITDMNLYKVRFDELNARLAGYHGIYPVGKGVSVNTMPYMETGKLMQMLAMIGVIASGLIVFDNIFKNTTKFQYSILILGILGVVAVSRTSQFRTLNVLFGLISTITFSSLAVTVLLNEVKKAEIIKRHFEDGTFIQFLHASKVLFYVMCISLCGTLFLATLYGNSEYMLEFSKFSGVKISQLTPLIIIVLSYLSIIGFSKYYDKNKSMMEQVKLFSGSYIKVWQAAIVFIMLAALAMMLLRSGHSNTNVEPSSTEILMRNVFEFVFPARPRNKAIYVGYPALLAMMMFAYKNKYKVIYPILALAATIGQTDILNTFSHIRTPYILSLKRVAIEYVFAVLLTFIVVLIVHLIYTFYRKRNLK